jgi:hypothetical protein
MRLNILLAAAAIAAMTAGAAAAQTSAAPGGSDTSPAPMNSGVNDPAATAPSADQNGTPASASMGNPNVTVESSPTPVASAYTLKAGDPNVISNPPIPDTPANRAQFGKPMSNAGRHTAAAGN